MANLAAANVMHRKTRTGVSVLAVAVEVAMVMVMVGLANGTLNGIARRLQNVGADVLFQPPDASLILGATTATMPVELMDVMKTIPGVQGVTPVLNWHISRIRNESTVSNLWAVDPASYAAISGGFVMVEGHALAEPHDLIVDTIMASASHLGVGDEVQMIDRSFRIAGVFKAGAGGRIYARLEDIQEAIGTPGKASFFLVKGTSSRDSDLLARALEERFPGYKITTMAQLTRAMQDSAVGLEQFKKALTAIAVIISFLVVLLAMYTAVIERTREIGILRAIGATQAMVVRIVIGESLLICAAGIVAGIILAAGGGVLVHRVFPTQSVELTRDWAAIAGGLGFVGGLLGSVYPALRAARLDPVQALNFE